MNVTFQYVVICQNILRIRSITPRRERKKKKHDWVILTWNINDQKALWKLSTKVQQEPIRIAGKDYSYCIYLGLMEL